MTIHTYIYICWPDGVCVRAYACVFRQVLYNPRKFGLDAPYDVVVVTPPYEEVVYGDLVKALAASDVSNERLTGRWT